MRLRALLDEHGVPDHCRSLLGSFKERAVGSLRNLDNDSMKGLLRRLMGKIFVEQVEGWCKEELEAAEAAKAASATNA